MIDLRRLGLHSTVDTNIWVLLKNLLLDSIREHLASCLAARRTCLDQRDFCFCGNTGSHHQTSQRRAINLMLTSPNSLIDPDDSRCGDR